MNGICFPQKLNIHQRPTLHFQNSTFKIKHSLPIRPIFAVDEWLSSSCICCARSRESHPAGCAFAQAAPSAPGAPVLLRSLPLHLIHLAFFQTARAGSLHESISGLPSPPVHPAGCVFTQAAPSAPGAPVLLRHFPVVAPCGLRIRAGCPERSRRSGAASPLPSGRALRAARSRRLPRVLPALRCCG